MALLTPLGLARLFPGCASEIADALVDAASVVGDRDATAVLNDASARPDNAAAALDDWMLSRLSAIRPTRSIDLFEAAARELNDASRVSVASDAVGVTRRHLSRLVKEHLGISPKELLDLHRLDRSLSAVQKGGDGAAGFSDQAHQIREWRRRLGTTPGRYARGGRSQLAETFSCADPTRPYYL